MKTDSKNEVGKREKSLKGSRVKTDLASIKSKLLGVASSSWTSYLVTFFLGGFLVISSDLSVNFYDSGIAAAGGDMLAFQAQFQVAGQAGPWGTSENLSWPLGSNNWSGPQAGLLMLLQATFFMKVLGFTSMGAYWGVFVTAGALSAAAVLFFIRSIAADKFRVVAISLAVSLGAGPFVILKMPHVNVASFYLVPFAMAIFLRSATLEKSARIKSLFLMMFLGGLLAPTWWVAVTVIVLFMLMFFAIFDSEATFRRLLGATFALVLGFLIPLGLIFANNVPSSKATRGPWDSNHFGGHLTDFFLGSPFINSTFTSINGFRGGSSAEMSYTGLIGSLLCFGALLALLVHVKGSESVNNVTRPLYALTVVLFCLFLLGGMGNLQAGVAAAFGVTSPARVWSRLIIAIAIVGAGWLILSLSKVPVSAFKLRGLWRQVGYSSLVLAIAVSSLLDFSATTPLPRFNPVGSYSEWPAVSFITTSLSPCPVAQLPVDSSPMSDVLDDTQIADFLYTGYLPFIIAPEYYWSFGDTFAEVTTPLAKLPITVGQVDFQFLRTENYCAVLFDKELSQFVLEKGVPLSGSKLAGLGEPDFNGDRFDVFLLD